LEVAFDVVLPEEVVDDNVEDIPSDSSAVEEVEGAKHDDAASAEDQRPPKGQHHHWEASFSKSEILSRRRLDEADHMRAHQNIGLVGPDLLVCCSHVGGII
jgi:hypothetical protein